MTVKELKEKLNQFPDNCLVMIPNERLHIDPHPIWAVHATSVTQGINEFDGMVFICDYTEDDLDD